MTASGRTADPTDRPRPLPLLTRLLATGLFTGYIPWASGTFGSLLALAFYAIPGAGAPSVLLPLIGAGFVAGVITAAQVARVEGPRLSATARLAKDTFQPGVHAADPSIVVIDEIVGMWIALLFQPPGAVPAILAFLAFRAFDIVKPPPARQLERIPGGWGIMLDDVVAGIYANAATVAILAIAKNFFPR